jgi:hypothetical protein
MVKPSLEKRPSERQTQQAKRLTSPEISIPLHHDDNSSKSKGFWRSKWLHLKERLSIGRNE